MKILFNNYLNSETESKDIVTVTCATCGSILEITDNDLYGKSSVLCPCCKRMFEVDVDELFLVTTKNVSYPKHFTVVNANVNKNIKLLTDEEINQEIKKGIKFLQENSDREYHFISYGEMFLVILKFEEDGEYLVVVTKDFSEAFVNIMGDKK